MLDSPFRIDVYTSDGTKVGSGPITNILKLDDKRILDRIGSLIFQIPLRDPKSKYISPAYQYDVFDEVDGYLGRFLYRNAVKSVKDGRGIYTVNCWSATQELMNHIIGLGRDYQQVNLKDILNVAIGSVPNWSIEYETGAAGDLTSTNFQGQNAFEAIEELTKRWTYHFRLKSGTSKTVEIGRFGQLNEAVRFTNLGVSDGGFDEVTEVAIIKDIEEETTIDDVYNRVIAVGAGNGASMLVMNDGDVGTYYTVQSRTQSNSQPEYYIEDTQSIEDNGIREITLIFDDIRPIANTNAAKSQAQTELLKNAELWLIRHKDPRIEYSNLTVYGQKKDVNVGELIAVRYKEFDDYGDIYMDVDDTFWVTEISRTRSITGDRSHIYNIVNTDRAELKDSDIMAKAVKGLKSEKLWIKPVAFRMSDTYSDFAANSNSLYDDKDAIFNVKIDDTVTDITRFIIEWRTKPIFCTSVWSSSGLTETLNANPTTPHKHSLNLSTLATTGLFTILESDVYPTDISLVLNGVTIDSLASIDYLEGGSGEWNSGGSGSTSSLFVRMDITDYILGLAGGIYQNFQFKFVLNTARTRDTAIPYYTTNTPQNNSTGNQGIFEFRSIIQGVAQGIYKS